MVATNRSSLFKKGVSGNPSGKPKGTKNKRSFDFAQICSNHDFDPCLELIKIVRTEGASIHAKVQACSEIMSYLAPKLKAVEVSAGEHTEKFQMTMNFGTPKEGEETVADGVYNIQREQDSK